MKPHVYTAFERSRILRWLNTVCLHSLDLTLTRVQERALKALRIAKFKCSECAVDQKVAIGRFIVLPERRDFLQTSR